jgi:hypothetical protein
LFWFLSGCKAVDQQSNQALWKGRLAFPFAGINHTACTNAPGKSDSFMFFTLFNTIDLRRETFTKK